MSLNLKPLIINGKEYLPLVEGGKGISATNWKSAGAWAAAGGIGTISAVNADYYDENGDIVLQTYKGKTRGERHLELIEYGIKGGIAQIQKAHELRNGQGKLNINVLWEMGGVEPILEGILSKVAPLVNGVTCGAGLPFKLSEICAKYGIYYYPIVSSARAFRVLWKRSYFRFPENLGAVVYEDPWLAGGHNGLSNSEDPEMPEDPYPRVKALREVMRECGVGEVPIIMAGGVWYLRDWDHWLNNEEIGNIAFQFGTRPLLTQESPIPEGWKSKLLTLKKGDIKLNRFSPTGFYSSAVRNSFLLELESRSKRQVSYTTTADDIHIAELPVGARGRLVYIKPEDVAKVGEWKSQGFTEAMRTPDETLVFVEPERAQQIHTDQVNCMGCLSACNFSNWSTHGGSTERKADPRSYCIQKTLQNIAHGKDADNELMFAGHGAYKFADDPFYANGFVPTVGELVQRILTGS